MVLLRVRLCMRTLFLSMRTLFLRHGRTNDEVMTSPPESTASSPRGTVCGGGIPAVTAQVSVLGVTFVMRGLGFFTAQNA